MAKKKAIQNLKVFTAFSGYDSQCMALERLKKTHGLTYDLVGWSEIDKYAIQSHDAVFPKWKNRNYGDISKIDWDSVPDFNLFTYSFPCTDISVAGQQKGLEKGSGTRSSLLWECEKAIKAKRPKYLLMENVKALASKKFMPFLQKWIRTLEKLGYRSWAKVLDSQYFGVPQHRERLFVVSILDCPWNYVFPKPTGEKVSLADILEPEVDEKYYMKDETVQRYLDKLVVNREQGKGFGFFQKSPAK